MDNSIEIGRFFYKANAGAGQFLNVDGGLMLTNWFNTPGMQQIGREGQ